MYNILLIYICSIAIVLSINMFMCLDTYANRTKTTISLLNKTSLNNSYLLEIPNDPKEIPVYPIDVYRNRLNLLNCTIKMTHNAEVQSHIEKYVFSQRSHISKMIGMSEVYFPIFEKYLKEKGLPEELKYLPIVESALKVTAVSKSGATGHWQFLYQTGKAYNLEISTFIDERKDPVLSTKAAVQYLSDLYARYNDWQLVLAAYNCGPATIDNAIQKAGGVKDYWTIRPFLTDETANYVPAFIATTYALNFAPQHNIKPSTFAAPLETEKIIALHTISLEKMSRYLGVSLDLLTLLNPKYSKQIVPGSMTSPEEIILPKYTSSYYQDFDTEILGRCEVELSVYENGEHSDFTDGAFPDQKELMAMSNVKDSKYFIQYTVVKGDNLISIANEFGITALEIRESNGLESSNVAIGQILYIKKPSAADHANDVWHTVKQGETLTSIANRYKPQGMTVEKLMKINNISNASAMSIGMKLKII